MLESISMGACKLLINRTLSARVRPVGRCTTLLTTPLLPAPTVP